MSGAGGGHRNVEGAAMNFIEDGLYQDMSWEDYDAIDRARLSHLREFKKSPAHFRWRTQQPREETDALTLGSATHRSILEPEKYRNRYAIWDGPVRAGNKWKIFEAQALGLNKISLTEKMHEEAQTLSNAVRNNPDAAPFLASGKGELSLLWTSPPSNGQGFECKSRIDFLSDKGAIIDVKTCRDGSLEGF